MILLFIGLCLSKMNIVESREKRDVPNWAMTSSDFFGWIEELRNHAGYDKIEELARTFWAHFPSASRLGYDPPAPEE
uniref:Si:ch73-23l24.1 n=1 Tax=Astyanax mexicanus TaxID=7994 RepID=A0A3B1JHN7_ASTMX